MSSKLGFKKELENEVLYKSLIGKNIEITESKNKNQIGLKGKIVNETASFFIISKNGLNSKILKRNIVFKTIVKEKALYIDGRFLFNTLTNRIKKIKWFGLQSELPILTFKVKVHKSGIYLTCTDIPQWT